jgi:hypothetical protein
MQAYEKLGVFYLGRLLDPATGKAGAEPLLYDARDLTTHAVCVGMTGSGKTGLCLSLIEEAAIDGIPVLAIDPKGDLGNLLLAFPDLRAADFEPWVDEGEAARKGLSRAAYAEETAKTWREGLARWDQDGERIARFRDAADRAIYTPGSSAGLPLGVLRSLAAPPAALVANEEALLERVQSTVSGLLALLGVDADPMQSREHILLSRILHEAWGAGRDLEIAALIREIQSPPFTTVGVMDLESFFPAKERFALSLSLNNLVASPAFASWTQGEPLDIPRLLWTAEGKPRVSIFSIAHLPDAQRMFFVTTLLGELLAWVRTQTGTTSLRAILYMDEVFGYFPPTANPPSKTPMLTLLKQARAFGLGCVLATQNPVDLDYKGLSNAGTWFLGRLQTERDKERVLDGLEGASSSGGAAFDRAKIGETLARLESRVFLMNNVHEDRPALFQTRWALSYLRGPLSRPEIERLMRERKGAGAGPAGTAAPQAPAQGPAPQRASQAPAASAGAPGTRPVLPPDVKESFLRPSAPAGEGAEFVYRPALYASARVHFVSAPAGVDLWRDVQRLGVLGEGAADPWGASVPIAAREQDLAEGPEPEARFAPLPPEAASARSYASWSKGLREFLYRSEKVTLWKSAELGLASSPGETERDFRVRLALAARERRDGEVEKLRTRYAPKLVRLEERIRAAEARVAREESEYKSQQMQSAVSIGATILGAMLGRRAVSSTSLGRATTAARSVGRAARQRGDIARAEESVESLREQLATISAEFETEAASLQAAGDPASLPLQETPIAPRKADTVVGTVRLVWAPWKMRPDGSSSPAYA